MVMWDEWVGLTGLLVWLVLVCDQLCDRLARNRAARKRDMAHKRRDWSW